MWYEMEGGKALEDWFIFYDIIIEEKMAQVLMDNYNFSKIGKYISNKLHHIHKSRKEQPRSTLPPTSSAPQQERSDRSENKENKRRKVEWLEPTVGSYQVNYSAIDKNIHNCNFHRSTPHFFGQKHHLNEITACLKDYPDAPPQKQKGLTDLGRMTGRDQIKGSIRRNMENPHQNRFHLKRFPVLTPRAGTVAFSKMSPRNHSSRNQLPLPDYDVNFQVTMKRLNSHIIGFDKQTSRYQEAAKTLPSQDYRTQQQEPLLVDKTVSWSKQLPRQVEGMLPSYMDKSINSRMAISLVNLKTLEMNCSNIKVGDKKIPRRKVGQAKAVIYREKNCIIQE